MVFFLYFSEMDNRATSSVDPLDPNAYIQTQPATLARGNNSVSIASFMGV